MGPLCAPCPLANAGGRAGRIAAGRNRKTRPDKNLAGIVSLGDVAAEPRAADSKEVGEAIAEISEPSRLHK
jgi:hypothetical protein